MKRVLVNKDNEIVFEGLEANQIYRILNADVYSVSEEDEVLYSHLYTPLVEMKELKYEVHFELEFKGIDDWNRAVFKDINANLYFGDVNTLWVYNELGVNNKNVIQFYKERPNDLEYFGSSFNCEPHGGTQDFFKFKLV